MTDGPNAAWIVTVLGLYVLVSPFVFLESATGTYGLVFIVIPAVMINQMINEQHAVAS